MVLSDRALGRQLYDASIARSTFDNYRRVWNHYLDWCTTHKIVGSRVFDSGVVSSYVAYRFWRHPSASVRTIRAAVKFFQGRTDDDIVLSRTIRGATRIASQKPHRVRVHMYKDWVTYALSSATTDRDWSDAVVCAVGLLSLMRGSELTAIRRKDIMENGPVLSVHIRQSKTDKLCKGTYSILSEVADRLGVSPWLDHVRDYLRRHPTVASSEEHVFFKVVHGRRVRLSLSDLSAAVRRVARVSGAVLSNAQFLSAHSLRHGGATELLLTGADDLYVARIGRWASMSSMRCYISAVQAIKAGVSVQCRRK